MTNAWVPLSAVWGGIVARLLTAQPSSGGDWTAMGVLALVLGLAARAYARDRKDARTEARELRAEYRTALAEKDEERRQKHDLRNRLTTATTALRLARRICTCGAYDKLDVDIEGAR